MSVKGQILCSYSLFFFSAARRPRQLLSRWLRFYFEVNITYRPVFIQLNVATL